MSFIRLGKLEIDLDELTGFIVKAKKHCYAGEGEETILPDGSKQLTFQEGNFHYTDNYDGYYQAPGRELVRWQREAGKRIWQMSYSGGMLPQLYQNCEIAKETFDFLKKALSQISADKPFRGRENPPFLLKLKTGEWIYRCKTNGDLERFNGKEEISYRAVAPWAGERVLFSQDYNGGLVIPK